MKKRAVYLKSRGGMTLVELMVFMSLTLVVLASGLAAVFSGTRMDASSEEENAGWAVSRAELEYLQSLEFEEIMSQCNTNINGQPVKRIWWTKLLRREAPAMRNLFGDATVEFVPGMLGSTSNYLVRIHTSWHQGLSGRQTNTLTTVIYPTSR